MDLCRSTIPGRPWWNTETSTCWAGSTTALGYRVRKEIGKGALIVLGTMLRNAEMRALAASLCDHQDVQRAGTATENIILAPRSGPGGNGMVAIELFNREGTITLDAHSVDLITGTTHHGEIPIAPYGVMVFHHTQTGLA